MDRIAVTGAGGFIGEALCRRLSGEGRRVVGVDAAPGARRRVEAAGAEFRLADVTHPDGIAGALDACDAVVHAAAIVSDTGRMEDFVRVNVRGTRNVLDAGGARRAVCLGSVAGWGYEFSADVLEDTPPKPCGIPYVDTKGAAETLALLRGATVVRPGDVYGARSVPWVLRPLEALRRGLFRLPGDGGGLMTPVFVDDLVDCIVLALDEPAAAGRAYTCWDGRAVPAREFFGHHARWLGMERVPTIPRPVAVAAGLVQDAAAAVTRRPPVVSRHSLAFVSRRAAYPNARARQELGWEPRVPLEEGMRRTEAALREQGALRGGR